MSGDIKLESLLAESSRSIDLHKHSAINDYFYSLGKKLPKPPQTEPTPGKPEKEVQDGKTMWCTVTTYTLQKNPDEIVLYSPDIEALWPGSLIQGNSLDGVGSFKELPIDKRAPLDIAISVLAAKNTATIKSPNAVSVAQTVGGLIESLSKAKATYTSNVSFNYCETYSLDQALLQLGIAANYAGADFRARHSEQTTSERRVISASYIEKCFTAYTRNPPTPASLFNSNFSLDDIREQARNGRIGSENIPVLLTTVAYGRMFYCTISSSHSFSEIKNALSLSYNASGAGGSATLDAGTQKILNESTFTVSAIGVPHDSITSLIQTGKLQEFFGKPMDITTAAPISYIFRNLSDLSIASYTNAGSYKMKVCRPEAITGDVMTHTSNVTARFGTFCACVEAAEGNRDDAPTREERIRGYRVNHALLINELSWLIAHIPQFTDDDKAYCKSWIATMIDNMNTQLVTFKSEGANRPWAQAIYAEAYASCSDAISVAQALLGKL